MEKKIKTKTLRQSTTFKSSPEDVYELLMDSKKHAGFSGTPASISRKVGGKFTCYDNWIEGKNLKLTPNKLIVQAWRGADWPKGYYSTVTFKFTKSGKGTKLTFTQTGLPEKKYKDISDGWKEHYWEKMKLFLGE